MRKCRKYILAGIGGLGFGFCIVAGSILDTEYSLDFMSKSFYLKWMVSSFVIGIVLHFAWEWIGKWKVPALSRLEIFERRLSYPILMAILIAFWLPAWFSIFPGVFSYDAYDEWSQICTGVITAHHPVLHVLFLGGIVEAAYQLVGSYNLGIALCTGIQMVILAAVFAYTIRFMREQNVNPLCRLFALAFYGLSPVVQLFAICGTKDTLFAAAFLLFLINIYRIVSCGKAFFENRGWVIIFVISAVSTMIMRNNGLYIVGITLVVLLFACRKSLRKYLLVCITIVAIYGIYVGPFYSILQVTPGGVQELLSVPLQQIARVYQYEKDSFSEDEIDYLYEIVPKENWELYRSTVSDYVKSGFREEVFKKDPSEFFELWLKTGIKHPFTYINSFLVGTVDFWYPFAVVDGYQDVYGKSSYYDYKVSEPGTEIVLLPGLHNMYEAISHDKETQKQPALFLLLSPGWYLMIFFFVFLYMWREKRYGMLLTLLPILLNFGTVLLGPIALVRYVLILFFVFPVYCVWIPKKFDFLT